MHREKTMTKTQEKKSKLGVKKGKTNLGEKRKKMGKYKRTSRSSSTWKTYGRGTAERQLGGRVCALITKKDALGGTLNESRAVKGIWRPSK